MPRAHPRPIPLDNLLAGPNELDWRAFERSRRQANRSRLTIDSYQQACADLANFRPGLALTDLDKGDLADYFVTRLGELAATTVAIRFRSLRAFYNWAEKEEIVEKSPMKGMSEPKVTDRPPSVLDDDQLRTLLAACKGTDFESRRDEAIIRVFCEPGSPRVAEMAAIGLDDVDWRMDRITLRGKGDRVRMVPFGAKTGTALDRYRRLRQRHKLASSPRLWLGVKKTVLSASGIAQMLDRRAVQAGIGHIHPHQLRHTSADAWFRAHDDERTGGTEREAMELFGWRSDAMPKRYGRSAVNAAAQETARRRSLGDRL